MQLSNLTLLLDPATAAPGANPSLPGFPATAGSDTAENAFDGLLASAGTVVAPGGPTPQTVPSAPIDPSSNAAVPGDVLLPTAVLPKPSAGTKPDEATQEAIVSWLGFMATTSPPPPPNIAAAGTEVAGDASVVSVPTDSTTSSADILDSSAGSNPVSAPPSTLPGTNTAATGIAPAASSPNIAGRTNIAADQPAAPVTPDATPPSVANADGRRTSVRARENRAGARGAGQTATAAASPTEGLSTQSAIVSGNVIQSSPTATSPAAATVAPADQGGAVPFAPTARRSAAGSGRDTREGARAGQAVPLDASVDPAEAADFSTGDDDGTFVNQPMPVSDPRALTPLPRVTAPTAAPLAESEDPSAAELVESVAAELSSDAQPDSNSARPGVRTNATDTSASLASNAAAAASQRPEAKFAAQFRAAMDSAPRDSTAGEKNSIESEGKQVTRRSDLLGINAAKPETLMPASAFSAQPPLPAVERSAATVAPLEFNAFAADRSSPEAEVAQAARRSVESAIEVSRHFASGDKRAVTLQFSVSGVDLGVRVELRGDAVHTTFRTDSPELRAALAQEWQSVAASQTGERSSRLADPVFTSAGSSSHSGADSGAADQRGSQARQQQQLFADAGTARAMLRNKTPILAPSAVPVASSLSRPGRLHTFA